MNVSHVSRRKTADTAMVMPTATCSSCGSNVGVGVDAGMGTMVGAANKAVGVAEKLSVVAVRKKKG